MGKFDVIKCGTPEQLADAVADQFLRQFSDAGSADVPFCVALSGGRIARLFFQATARKASQDQAAFSRTHFFWGDERCVPPSDPESNFAMARDLFLVPQRIPASQVHRVRGEDDPATAAKQAADELRKMAPSDANGQPVLDLVLLGMGEDGHVASLFPGEPAEAVEDKAVFRAVTAVKPPPKRITLGYAAIVAAKEVWVLASGAGKEVALRSSTADGGTTPLARVLRLREQTRIYTDIQ